MFSEFWLKGSWFAGSWYAVPPYNCNRALFSESGNCQWVLVPMVKPFVATVAVVAVSWSYEGCRRPRPPVYQSLNLFVTPRLLLSLSLLFSLSSLLLLSLNLLWVWYFHFHFLFFYQSLDLWPPRPSSALSPCAGTGFRILGVRIQSQALGMKAVWG